MITISRGLLSKEETLHLNNQLCFSIYACSREITQLYHPLLKQLKLTYPQYLVMLVLWEHLHITMKELGEHLYLDNGTLTPLIRRLKEAEFIEKKRSSEDERKVIISLTKKGRELKEKAYNVPESIMPVLLKDEGLKERVDELLLEIYRKNKQKKLTSS